jgi:hypothetical protein
MKKYIVTSAIFVGVFFLVSCFSQENTSIPNSPIALSTSSATVTPTQTLHPSLATNIAYFATLDASINGTITARGVACPQLYQLQYSRIIIRNSNSNWTVFTCALGKANLTQEQESFLFDTFVKSIDEKQTWIISHEDAIWFNTKSVQLEPYKWTPDGKYLYLMPVLGSGGSGFYAPGYFWDNYGLYRLNLITGEIETILPYLEKGYSFSLSPSNEYLAYSKIESVPIHIKSMINNEEELITLNDDYVLTGAFAWSRDNSSLLFASAINGWEDGDGGISIYKVRIKDLRLENILLNDKRLLIPFPEYETNNYWSSENLLYVKSLNYLSYEYFSELALDVQSGNVAIVSTPEPSLIGSPTPKP